MYKIHAQGTRRRSRTTAAITAWAVALLGLGVLLAPSAGAAAGSANAAAQIPQAYGGALSAVACPSATVCVAVGTQRSATGAAQAFAEVRHGSTVWTLTSAVPTPVNARQTSLAAVACPSAGSCMAVGTYHDAYDDQRPFAASCVPSPCRSRRHTATATVIELRPVATISA